MSSLNIRHAHPEILTPAAVDFLTKLVKQFSKRRDALLEARTSRGIPEAILEHGTSSGQGDFRVARLPDDLQRRHVEITGPVDRKMIINALNSGADVFMADFEDSNAPTWNNVIEGQVNLRDAVARTISLKTDKKSYALGDRIATLMVRPRGWHLDEAHILYEGKPVPASLVDFGLYFFHNVTSDGPGSKKPYFYLPKLESHLEARLWNDVFVLAQNELGLPVGTVKATVLIETLPAAFEMDEILYELRDHSAGLNCGRWDYIFSYIKTLRDDPAYLLPDRSQVGMTQPNMAAYTSLLIQTCHKRGAHAMGGMAAQIPIKNDPEANEAALAKVRADKEREANDGHDGTWVAHPGLVPIAKAIFEEKLGGADNQLHVLREDVHVTRDDLLAVPQGTRTEEGLRHNVRVGIQYLEAWLRGSGCVPLYNLMEDAATAEISRTQIWQWLKHGAFTKEQVAAAIDEEMTQLSGGKFAEARALFTEVATNTDQFTEFLTLPAYEHLVS